MYCNGEVLDFFSGSQFGDFDFGFPAAHIKILSHVQRFSDDLLVPYVSVHPIVCETGLYCIMGYNAIGFGGLL